MGVFDGYERLVKKLYTQIDTLTRERDAARAEAAELPATLAAERCGPFGAPSERWRFCADKREWTMVDADGNGLAWVSLLDLGRWEWDALTPAGTNRSGEKTTAREAMRAAEAATKESS